MRILTNSLFETKGLISVFEAGEHVPQTVIFCIPIDIHDAERIQNLDDFDEHFSNGISTKINDRGGINTIYLDYKTIYRDGGEIYHVPRFVANIRGHKIDFYLSLLNFSSNNGRLNIDYHYSGDYLRNDLFNKKLVILEPDWRQLDKLFLEERVVFVDWNNK